MARVGVASRKQLDVSIYVVAWLGTMRVFGLFAGMLIGVSP